MVKEEVLRDLGEAIINLLAKIEDIKKNFWEKPKFVIETNYVITIDKVYELTSSKFAEKLIEVILRNQAQLYEWEVLFGIKIKNKDDLIKNHSVLKLPVDTRYFPSELKFELLEELSQNHDLDDILDGLLIKSENWQALNLILNKYKEKIQTIYIDPPFNKEQDADYLYSVKYEDSTWATMLENRLRLAKDLLKDTGSIFVRCDYNGNWILRPLMNEIFRKENFRNEIIVNRFKKPAPKALPVTTESFLFYSKTNNTLFNLVKRPRICTFCKQAIPPRWHPMSSPGEGKPAYILGKLLYPPKGRHWTFNQDTIYQLEKEGRIRINNELSYIDTRGVKVKGLPEYLETEEQNIDSNWTDITGYKFGSEFQTENSEEVIKRVIESTSNEGDFVMDFFLGSGTTTAVAHKLKRKWIGVELGEHFWTIVLPRMKKVLFYDKSGISKVEDVKEKYNEKTAGGFFKYQIIEQYEDTLDNIEFTENEQARLLFKDDYLIKYYTHIETQNSPFLLNIEQLRFPFNYKLKFNPYEVGSPIETVIDIPETFSYLFGVKVKKVAFKKPNNNPHLFILAEKDNLTYLIAWHNDNKWCGENNSANDCRFVKEFIEKWKPNSVFINLQALSIFKPQS